MATTTFVDKVTIIPTAWLNDVDATVYQGILGVSGSNYQLVHVGNDKRVVIAGGSSTSSGANIFLQGGAQASFASDMDFRANSNAWMRWDESVGDFEVLTGNGSKTSALTIDSSQNAAFAGEVTALNEPYLSLITTKNVESTDNGRYFGLNLANGFTITLPTIAPVTAGWHCYFRVETAPTTAYIITEDTGSDTNVLTGGFSSAELTDAAVAAYSAAFTQINFVASAAAVGDWVKISTNGSRFYVEGHTNVQAGVTVT